ncbi:MAG: hypothetical protein IJM91_05220 [Lachnospiraceae bacterium]|nr:hypothetical protein [Lachnospiraceae bacterium]
MVNENKVRLMTKLTVFEENKGRRPFDIGDYYKSDFISKNLIFGFIAGTIAYAIGFGFWAVYNEEVLVEKLLTIDFGRIVFGVIVGYAVFMVLYLTVCYLVSEYKYRKTIKSLKSYKKALKKLENW